MNLERISTVLAAKIIRILSADKTEPATVIRPPLPIAEGGWAIRGLTSPRWFVLFGRRHKENAHAS